MRFYTRKGAKRSQRSSLMTGATSLGITVEAYMAHLDADERWCSGHRAWEHKDTFSPRPERHTGVASVCRLAERERKRAKRLGVEVTP